MTGALRYCPDCLTALEGDGPCGCCGRDPRIPNPPDVLKAGTVINGTYLVGRALKHNDLTTLYRGLHLPTGEHIYLEEFFPRPLASRSDGKISLTISEGNGILFKTLYSDLADRWSRLLAMQSNSIVRVREVLKANNALICVQDGAESRTLRQYLDENGRFTWDEIREQFMPLMTLTASLHNQGMIHCGIAPENILVSEKDGRFLLTGFSLPDLRTARGGSALTPELYAGFSAPEQYSRNHWQGEWTDIYALGAVLYQLLTGIQPPAATERMRQDTLRPASEVVPNVPANLSAIIARAMSLKEDSRYQSADEMIAALLSASGASGGRTSVFVPKTEETHPASAKPAKEPAKPKPKTAPGTPMWVKGLLLLSLAANLACGMLLYAQRGRSAGDGSTAPEAAEPNRMEYRLIGTYLWAIEENPAFYGNLDFEVSYDYDEQYPDGVVVEQSVRPGDILPEDNKVSLKVSKGSRYVTMPYLHGSSSVFASRTLSELGIQFEFDYDVSAGGNAPSGTVVGVSREYGERLAKDTDKVIVTVKLSQP